MQPGGPVTNPTIAEIVIADAASTWRDLGFRIEADEPAFTAGTVQLRLSDAQTRGVAGWALRDVLSTDLDGLPTEHSRAAPLAPSVQPNGVLALDHLVAVTPSLDRTAAALDDAGIRLRRVRELGTPQAPSRQGFFRLGEVILEVVQRPRAAGEQGGGDAEAAEPARFWGLVFVVGDLDALGALLGDQLGAPRDAVQPGRRIATLRPEAQAGCPVAFITPEAPRPVVPAATPREP